MRRIRCHARARRQPADPPRRMVVAAASLSSDSRSVVPFTVVRTQFTVLPSPDISKSRARIEVTIIGPRCENDSPITFCNPSLISRTSREGHEFSGRVGLDERKPADILGRRPAGRPQFSLVMRRSGWGRNDSPVIHGAGACTEPDLVLYNRRQREPHPGGGWLVNFGISMAVTRLQRAEGVPTERMSPELVLVSPDLAGSARASLSDCPWEAFLPQQPPPGNRRSGPGTTPRTPDGQTCSPVCLDRGVPRSRRRRQHPAGPDGPTLARADSSPAAFQPLSQGFFVPRTHTTQLRGRAARTSPAASAGPHRSTRAARRLPPST